MGDFWGFLLQTLTLSGGAALLLGVKALFRDKLSPRWQCAVWLLLGGMAVLPAGELGRYALVNWRMWVEWLKTLATGTHTITRVDWFFPIPTLKPPADLWEGLFLIYWVGVLAGLVWYGQTYLRLRRALKRGAPPDLGRKEQIQAVAQRYQLPVPRVVVVPGLPTAFVCGVFSPVLALPQEGEVEDGVLLHELLHLKHRDVLWGLFICLVRCLHWCNPLLWYSTNQAANDLECLCDQRVLERLEGEQRRDYGRTLLSMANRGYAHTPGTSSMANGGKNIRRRIEAIARFRRYPAGMGMVSLCVAILLGLPMLVGAQASQIPSDSGEDLALAAARSVWCSTPAGALDAYGKALLTGSLPYRAMCAPEGQLESLSQQEELWPQQESRPDRERGYVVYNFAPAEEGYRATVVLRLQTTEPLEETEMKIGVVPVEVVEEQGRWVVVELEPPSAHTVPAASLEWGIFEGTPTYHYTGTAEQMEVEVQMQQTYEMDNQMEQNSGPFSFWSTTSFDLVPRPHDEFATVYTKRRLVCRYTGPENERESITQLGVSYAPWVPGTERPLLPSAALGNESGSSTGMEEYASRTLSPDWSRKQDMGGGGSSDPYPENWEPLPPCIAADLYLNGEKVAQMTLQPEEVKR